MSKNNNTILTLNKQKHKLFLVVDMKTRIPCLFHFENTQLLGGNPGLSKVHTLSPFLASEVTTVTFSLDNVNNL